jgi:hypothetical protein
MATPGSADYDAMVLLDMAGSAVTSPPATDGPDTLHDPFTVTRHP